MKNELTALKKTPMRKKILLIVCLIETIGLYVSFPFLAIYLIDELKIHIVIVGFMISILSFSSSFLTPISYFINKRINSMTQIIFSFFVIAIGYLLFSMFNEMIVLFALMFMIGLGKAIGGPQIKAKLAENGDDLELSAVFRMKYMTTCVGAIVGPLLGSLLVKFNFTYVFYASSIAYLIIILLLLTYVMYNQDFGEKIRILQSEKMNFNLLLDIKLLLLLLISTLVFIVFAIFQEVTPIALSTWNVDASEIFSLLLVVNSISALILMPISLFVEARIGYEKIFGMGLILFLISYILFAVSSGNIYLLIVGAIVFSFGEIFTIPALDVFVAKISNENNASFNYAISEFKQIGFLVAPILVSSLLVFMNAESMYFLVAIFCAFILFLLCTIGKKYKNN